MRVYKKLECEFCGEFKVNASDDTVCNDCDAQLEAEQAAAENLRNAAWGQTHKCRDCAAPLPKNRYFKCDDCQELETESEWDLVEPLDADEDEEGRGGIQTAIARLKDALVTGHTKTCRLCSVEKPRDSFPYCNTMKDGRLNDCKDCRRIKQRQYEVARRARAAEVA